MNRSDIYGGEDPSAIGAYSLAEVAHHLQIPPTTVRSWTHGRPYPTRTGKRHFAPIIVVGSERALTFQNLVEIHVLSALRRKYLVRLAAVRKAVAYLRREFRSQHPLADHQMLTDGKDLFVKHYGQLINASREGQLALRDLLDRYLKRVEREGRLAVRLFPFAGLHEDDDRPVVVDPRVEFGQPCVAGTGVPTAIIAERYKAGEGLAILADDYGISSAHIEGALRYELRLAA